MRGTVPASSAGPVAATAYRRHESEAAMRGFARGLLDVLDTHALPSRERQRLLTRAQRLGLDRFEANLLIAAAQHRRKREGETHPAGVIKPQAVRRSFVVPPRRSSLWPLLLTALTTQAAVLAGVAVIWFS